MMGMIAPEGPVYQAGTLSGNPLAMAAGLAMLKQLAEPGFYTQLEETSDWFAGELVGVAKRTGVPVVLNRVSSMMTVFFTEDPVEDYTTAVKADTKRYAKHFRRVLANGIGPAPSQFEAFFLSSAHKKEKKKKILEATEASFRKLMC